MVHEESQESKKEIEELTRKGAALRKEVLSNVMPKCIDFSRAKPGEMIDGSKYFLAQAMKKQELKMKVNEFKVQTLDLTVCKLFYFFRVKLPGLSLLAVVVVL